MLNLILHSEADKEFANARIWYEEQKSGLRKRFELSVEATIKKYKLLPNFFGYSRKPFREASIVLFPYTIVFKINKRNQTVYIVAIYHASRNPKKKYRK
jgi:hypothetical protein